MKNIDLATYLLMPENEQKQAIRQAILNDALNSDCKGIKMTFAAAKWNIDKVLKLTYQGYLAETAVLNYLNETEGNWEFINDCAGTYQLEFKPTNLPDLKNKLTGETVEVKGYKIYGNKVYFVSAVDDANKLYNEFFHNANRVFVYDKNFDRTASFDKEYFLKHVKSYENNQDSYKTTYELTLDDIKQLNNIINL